MEKVKETKRERFKRLATARTNRTISLLHLLGNCSNKSNYEYSSEDVEKIFSVLESELKNTKLKFKISKTHKNTSFTLE
ncbi:MAG: hypothetical protein AB9883_00985 [Acidaminococcaceae bacterium]